MELGKFVSPESIKNIKNGDDFKFMHEVRRREESPTEAIINWWLSVRNRLTSDFIKILGGRLSDRKG